MTRLLPCLLLVLPVWLQAPPYQDTAPSPELVARIDGALRKAYAARDLAPIQAALEEAWTVPDPAVVEGITLGLADERREVQLAALTALRWNPHADALEALHRVARDRKRMKDPELAATVLRGLGQHADPSSIPFLARDPFEPDSHPCRRARLFGLGRIRTRASLEALLGILAVSDVGAPQQRRIRGQMEDARTALIQLTGVDMGMTPEAWEEWWRKNKKTFEVPDAVPVLPKELRVQWDAFFGQPQIYEREKRREDRGK
jgi:hypothetical protein